jgi:hypothetical protein
MTKGIWFPSRCGQKFEIHVGCKIWRKKIFSRTRNENVILMAWINLFKWRFNIIQKKALGSIGTSLTWAVMDKLLTKNSRTILSEDPVPSYFVCVSIKTRQSVKCKIDSTVPLMSMSNQLIFIPCILSRHKLFYRGKIFV